MKTKIQILRQDAIIPNKQRKKDTGHDVTLTYLKEKNGRVELYGTGIAVQPEKNWWFELVPRSSISKTGYILANSVGVIDELYTGEVLVALIKIDETKPDLQLPIRLLQLIPRKREETYFMKVETLDETERGEKGFGSSGKI